MPVYIGTSGWQYRHWRGRFYPRDPPPESDLAYYAERFRTVELNATFYRLPEPTTVSSRAEHVLADFVFAVKASRYLTHLRRLTDPADPVRRLMARADGLGTKLGPLLVQLPPDLELDADRLRATLGAFPDRARVAVEFRHPSWFADEVRRLLEDYGAALCLADRGSKLITPAWRTADWGYLRLHGGQSTPASCYGRQTLAARARAAARLWGADADVYVYFNNDAHACALRNAPRFARAAGRVGLRPTRVPAPDSITVS